MAFSSAPFQSLLQDYYKTDIVNNKIVTRVNPYRGITWEKIFKNYKIISQKINSDGKCYKINIQIEKFGITVYVPPSAPLNVMESDKIYRSTKKTVTKYFASGEIGSQGIWFLINGLRNVFIPCSDIKENDDVCYDYIRDFLQNNKNQDLELHNISSKNSSILLELCIWMWRVSGLSLKDWFEMYVSQDNPNTDIFSSFNLNGEYILPKYNSVVNCIEWIAELNPEFKDIFDEEKIKVYPQLKENMYLYMSKIDSLTEGLDNSPNEYMYSMLKDKKDFNINKEEIIFDDILDLDTWKNDKFHDLEIFETLENRGIYIYRSDKGMYLVVNTKSIEETLLTSLYWNKSKKIVNPELYTPQLLRGVKNKVGYVLYDNKLKIIKESKKESMINVIFYNSNLYSTFIKLI